jgi:hypothetical protein
MRMHFQGPSVQSLAQVHTANRPRQFQSRPTLLEYDGADKIDPAGRRLRSRASLHLSYD